MDKMISSKWLKTAIHNFYKGLNHTPTEEDIQAYIDAAPSEIELVKIVATSDISKSLVKIVATSDISKPLVKLVNIYILDKRTMTIYDTWATYDMIEYLTESEDNNEKEIL